MSKASTGSHNIYSFNGFTVDLDRSCLLHRNQEVKIRPKVLETLKYLVENNNRLVTKDELMKAVWTDSFVTDDSLVQCLVELRRALGDEAQRCIKTVPRRGYIFTAEISRVRPPLPEVVHAEQAEAAKPTIEQTDTTKTARWRRIVPLTTLAIAALAVVLYFNRTGAPTRTMALTDKDTVLIADFVNTTGDEVFDGTLRQAMAVQLGQSPFLNIFSEERIRETLRYMGRSPDGPVTGDVAREIAQRQGIKALLTGSISSLGSHYVINLQAVNAQTGDTIAREQTEAESRERVLSKLGEAASKLRQKLGESLGSIEKFNAPIEQATTSSLDALKAYSLGREQQFSGKYFEAIPFYKRAVELDPNFAIAYAALGVTYGIPQEYDLAAQFSQKAFDLRERTSEREKLYISARYFADVQRDGNKTIEVMELWKQTYPRDFVPPTNLAVRYCMIGQHEKAIEESREAVRLNPDVAVSYASLAVSLIYADRYDEARAALEQALARKLEPPYYRYMLYSIALIQGDTAEMQKQVDASAGTPLETGMLATQSVAAASSGQLRKARELSGRAIDLAGRSGLKEGASQYSAGDALWEAAFGNCREAKNTAAKTLAIARGGYALSWSALALAICGAPNDAQPLVDEMTRRFPHDSYFKAYWVPMIHAAAEINRNNPGQAVQLLRSIGRGELGASAALWPAYLRGLAYLRQRSGNNAMAEFQKILDHRGVLAPKDFNPVAYSLYPLAHLGLARAAALAGDTGKSRRAYEDFFDLWKDADSDIPVLRIARNEYQNAP
ncbi:MAG TPA: winged helix-turn-helix domain-containing protein [Terriglobia bacterium]|nr:winged helix-turn-helix domain-containing protein [Terriglobia bacterium]